MDRKQLFEQIQAKKSMLCVGLDVDFDKMPEHVKALANRGELALKGELYKGKARSIIEFNKAIVDATLRLEICCLGCNLSCNLCIVLCAVSEKDTA